VLVDENSTNGTVCGGVRLSPQSPSVVRSGTMVRVGRVWVELRFDASPATPQPALAAKQLALELVTRSLLELGEPAYPLIKVSLGPDAGKSLTLDTANRRYAIGRGRDADLVLTDERLSRRHVEVGVRGASIVARDLGSKAGSRLDDAELGGEDTDWAASARLALGSTELACEHPAADALADIEAGSDEPMRPDEYDDAHVVSPGDRFDAPDDEDPEHAGDASPRAPVAHAPAKRAEGAWGTPEFVVVLVAVVVLVTSFLGLYWLLRG